jgi:uncharacterized protein
MSRHKFKILSIDGGGIKGVIPCMILAEIERRTGSPVSGLFNLIAGTSTGGIIGLGLSRPGPDGQNAYTANDMLDLYEKNGKDIFSRRREDFWSRLGSLFKKTKDIATHNYEIENFEKLLEQKFGDTRLGEGLIKLLVTTYDIQSGKPFYFSTRLALKDEKENILMRSVARATSAAPTFFEPSLVGYDEARSLAFVDGGVFANNPSILAYGEAKEIWKNSKPVVSKEFEKLIDPQVTPDDRDFPFYMLSLGCGHSVSKVDYSDAKDWRAIEWVQPLLTDVFMRSVEESTDYTMHYLLPPYLDGERRYQRVDLELPGELTRMDDASDANIARLKEVGKAFIKDNDQVLEHICKILQ